MAFSSQRGALFVGPALSTHGGRMSSTNGDDRFRSSETDLRSAFRRYRSSGRCQRLRCRDLGSAATNPARRVGRTIAGLRACQYSELLTVAKDRAVVLLPALRRHRSGKHAAAKMESARCSYCV